MTDDADDGQTDRFAGVAAATTVKVRRPRTEAELGRAEAGKAKAERPPAVLPSFPPGAVPEVPPEAAEAARDPSPFRCRPENPMRPLDWRRRLGAFWFESGVKPVYAGDDPGVARVKKFLTAVARGRSPKKADPALAEAAAFRAAPDDLAAEAESWLIAGGTAVEVAARTGLSVAAAEAFGEIHYDVADAPLGRLTHLAVRPYAPPPARSEAFAPFVRRLVAYGLGRPGLEWLEETGGPIGLGAAAGLSHRPTPAKDADLFAAMDERFRRKLALTAYVAVATWQLTTPQDCRVAMKLYKQLLAREATARRRQGRRPAGFGRPR